MFLPIDVTYIRSSMLEFLKRRFSNPGILVLYFKLGRSVNVLKFGQMLGRCYCYPFGMASSQNKTSFFLFRGPHFKLWFKSNGNTSPKSAFRFCLYPRFYPYHDWYPYDHPWKAVASVSPVVGFTNLSFFGGMPCPPLFGTVTLLQGDGEAEAVFWEKCIKKLLANRSSSLYRIPLTCLGFSGVLKSKPLK